MASPLVRRQITLPPLFPTSSQTASPRTTPSPATPTPISTATGGGLVSPVTSIINGVSSLLDAMSSSRLSSSQSTTSSEPTSTPPSSITSTTSLSTVSSTPTPSGLRPGPNGSTVITETISDTAPSSSATSEPKGKSFLENKPLAGFVFGLVGLVVVIIVIIGVTSFKRRRNRKRLLADASNFSFDPKHIEDKMSDEKHTGISGRRSSGHNYSDYTPNNGATDSFAGVGMGRVSGRGSSPSSPMPAYIPQDYAGHDGGYPAQYHNPGNVPVGYNSTPNPYDVYGPRNSMGYPNGQGQHDPYSLSGSNGNRRTSMTDPNPSIPYPLRPWVQPTQGPTFAPILSTNPPPLNRLQSISSTTLPLPASLQPSVPNGYNTWGLPTPGALPDVVGRQNGADDDAYGGASFGRDPPPAGPGKLQVANM